jgi:hypothetical protein
LHNEVNQRGAEEWVKRLSFEVPLFDDMQQLLDELREMS